MKKIIKNEEVGRLAELAADYVKKNDDKRIVLTLDKDYSGDKFLRITISEARTWRELSSEEYLFEPESATAAGAFSEVLEEADKHKEEGEE